jgi:hypothetical protein
MNIRPRASILSAVIVLLAVTLACSGGATPEPTLAPPTNTPVPTVTPTQVPTSTPRPTRTPDVIATQNFEEIFSKVLQFEEEGLIPTTEGEYIELEDFSAAWAQLGWYGAYMYDLQLEHFVFVGHVGWSTAVDTRDLSGCGIVFGQQEDTSEYAVFLDKSRIFFSSSTPTRASEIGKTSGSGRLSLGNPAEVNLDLVVYQYRAYVYVDDEFIAEYSLPRSKPLKGAFGYGILSGTNRDYGTRCKVSQARIWELRP